MKVKKKLDRRIWLVPISKKWVDVRRALKRPRVITTSVMVPVRVREPYFPAVDPWNLKYKEVIKKKRLSQIHVEGGRSLGAIKMLIATKEFGKLTLGSSLEVSKELVEKVIHA